MKPIDAKPSIYFDFDKENNNKVPKFKVGDHVRISKYQNNFAKVCVPNWSAEVFVVETTTPRTYVISDLKGNEIIQIFCKKELKKTKQKEFKIGKMIKRKGN